MKPRVFIGYTTSEGQSAHVADVMAEVLREESEVTVGDLRKGSVALDEFDAVVLGGSVHVGHFQSELGKFIRTHVETLNCKPSWFYGVSLSEAIDSEPFGHEQALKQIDEFIDGTGWRPRRAASVAGAVKFRDYAWPKRLLMHEVLEKSGTHIDTDRNWEYTNWDGVRAFAAAIASELSAGAAELSPR